MAPVSARSTSKMKLLYALSEGEVEASGLGVLSSKDIYLDDVPITNQDGTNNYNVLWEFRKGVQNQEHINSLPTVENLQQVGFKVTTRNPYIHNLTNRNLDQVRVNLSFPALQRSTDKGDYYATTIEYAIDIATGAGGYVEVGKFKLHERFTSEYNRSHEFDLPESDGGWRVRVRRLTPDSDSMLIQDEFSVAAITEVIDAKLRYPNTALLYLEFDAEAFPQVPKVSVKMKGKVVRVPDNYNTENRTYSGVWSGRWKWGYTNNPVWCLLDVLLSETYGTGERIGLDQIDKWNFYRVAQWCDIRVPDGMGGEEPRHSLNVYLQKQTDAWRLLQDICSNFNGGLYWNGVQIEIFADIPSPIEYVYNQSNIVSGTITDAGINQKNKFSHALVKWDNPANNYETDTTATYDITLTRRHGVRTKDVAAFGVTSQGEAQRKGKWVLMENTFSRYSSFEVGLDGYIPRVGSVVGLVNNRLAGDNISGRIKSVVNNREVELDRECRVKVGDRLILNLPNGESQTRTVSKVAGNNITVSVAYSPAPKQGLAFNIDSDTLAVQKVRVLKSEQKGDTFVINVVEYNDSKQDYIDNGALIEKPPLTVTPITNQLPPTNLRIDQYETIEQGMNITHLVFKWNRVENAVTYEVSWSKDEGEWINVSPTPNSEVTISGVYSGVYQFSVRAVNAVGVVSQQVYSESKYISGKIGEVQPLAFLRTTSEVMGIRLDWGFKERSGDSSKTIIMTNTSPNDEGSTLLAELSYPTDTYTHRGLAHAREFYYKGQVVDKLGNKSEWTDWIHGSSSADADEILSYLDGQISETHLDGWLKEEIEKIPEIETSLNDLSGQIPELEISLSEMEGKFPHIDRELNNINKEVVDISNDVKELENSLALLTDAPEYDNEVEYPVGTVVKEDGKLYQALKNVPQDTPPPNAEYWEKIGDFESVTDAVTALVLRADKAEQGIKEINGELVSINTITSSVRSAFLLEENEGKALEAIQQWRALADASTELTAQADAHSSVVRRLSTLSVKFGESSASLTQLEEAFASEKEAIAKQITQLQASIDDKASIEALQQLTVRVNKNENGVTTNSAAITQLESEVSLLSEEVDGKASSLALQSLSNRVGANEGKIESHSSSITNLTANLEIVDKKAQKGVDDAESARQLASTKADGEAFQQLSTTVTEIDGRVTSNSANITELESGVERLSEEVDTKASSEALQQLSTEVKELEDGVSGISSSITQLETSLEVVDNKAQQGLDGVEEVREAVSTKADSSALEALTVEVEEQDGRISTNTSSIVSLNSNLEIVGEKVEDLEQEVNTKADASVVDNLSTMVEEVDGRVTSQAQTLTKLEASVNTVTEDVGGVADKVEANAEAINTVTTKVEEVDGEVSSLSAMTSSVRSSYLKEDEGKALEAVQQWRSRSEAEQKIVSQSDSQTALARRLSVLNVEFGESNASLKELEEVVATESEATANKITQLESSIEGKANSGVVNQLKTQVEDIDGRVSSNSSSIEVLQSDVSGNKAAIQSEAQTRTDADAAISTRIDTVQASVTVVNDKVDENYQEILDTITVQDTRNTNQPPSWYWNNHPKLIVQEFKQASVIGLSGFGTFVNLETRVPFSDSSNGIIIQIVHSHKDPTKTSQRYSINDTTWSKWDAPLQNISASVQEIKEAQATTDGKLSAMHGVKLQLSKDNKWVNAGYTIGIDGKTLQSTTIFDTNNFLIRNGVNGQSQTMFAVQGSQTIIRSALIGDATITMAKIGGDLYSTNYVAGKSGWRLQQDGTFEINTTVAGQGRIEINNKGMRVFDENGRIRVKIGDLR